MRRAGHIVALAALLAALCACNRARVIPESDMVRIYHDMFLADQWVRDHPDERAAVDTSLIFDPIFRRYGYDFEDYDLTVHFYIDHNERYVKLLNKVDERLRKEGERLQKEADILTAREVELNRFRRGYEEKDFSSDSLRWSFPQRLWPEDTTNTQPYGLFEEIQLQPRRRRGGEPNPGPDLQPGRRKFTGDTEKVLLPDGLDHPEVE